MNSYMLISKMNFKCVIMYILPWYIQVIIRRSKLHNQILHEVCVNGAQNYGGLYQLQPFGNSHKKILQSRSKSICPVRMIQLPIVFQNGFYLKVT